MTERKTPVEQALDLFFYAPVGFMFHAQEIVDELIEKGHQQVVAARMFGKFAVEDGGPKALEELQKRVGKVTEQFTGRGAASTNGPTAPATPATPATPASPTPPTTPQVTHGPAAASLAIPDYDSLSASQVVPRLEGLSGGELDAVRAYESDHRGRKTILSKIDQLQG